MRTFSNRALPIVKCKDFDQYFNIRFSEGPRQGSMLDASWRLIVVVMEERVEIVSYQRTISPNSPGSYPQSFSQSKPVTRAIPIFVFGQKRDDAMKALTDRVALLERGQSDAREDARKLKEENEKLAKERREYISILNETVTKYNETIEAAEQQLRSNHKMESDLAKLRKEIGGAEFKRIVGV